METFKLILETGGLLGAGVSFVQKTIGLDLVALLFAVLTPVLLLYGRHEVRLRRLRAIKDFVRSFGSKPESETAGPGGNEGNVAAGDAPPVPPVSPATQPRSTVAKRLATNPSFEFVKSKYISDVAIPPPADGRKFDDMSEVDQIDWIIASIGGFGSRADWRIFLSTVGMMLITYFGFSALGDTLVCGLSSDACACLHAQASENCQANLSAYGNWIQIGIIGALAFAGAYVAAIRTFVRAVAVFDLTPYTFLRQTAEIVASVIFTIVLFVVFRDPAGTIASMAASLTGGTSAEPSAAAQTTQIPVIWYGLAPLLGLLPQSATKFLMVKLQSLVSWVKTSDDRFIEVSKIVSLDIIDGIDYETRFRLEDCGIYDVQNLATYNPIMLHIESPYGIYQVIDWIAQAQLCHILGPEKFLIFRELNIRTVFDLERAISSTQSVAAFDEICTGVLFATTSSLKKTMQISGIGLLIVKNGVIERVGADDFSLWARLQIQGTDIAAAAEHVMRWISDDLHVRRLRRLWIDISDSLGPQSWYLPDNIDAPRRAPETGAGTV